MIGWLLLAGAGALVSSIGNSRAPGEIANPTTPEEHAVVEAQEAVRAAERDAHNSLYALRHAKRSRDESVWKVAVIGTGAVLFELTLALGVVRFASIGEGWLALALAALTVCLGYSMVTKLVPSLRHDLTFSAHAVANAKSARDRSERAVVAARDRLQEARVALQEAREREANERRERLAVTALREWEERERRREAQRREDERHAVLRHRLATRHQRFNQVRDAIVWMRHLQPQLQQYVTVHAAEILRDQQKMVARYHDAHSPLYTAERCRRLAHWFLGRFPDEVRHLLPEEMRTPEALAATLRTFHGREVEQMLPQAMAHVLRAALPKDPRPEPEPERLDPADPLSAVPPEDRARIRDMLREVRSLAALEEALEGERERYAAQLRSRRPVLEEEAIAHALEKYAANLDKLQQDWAAEKNLVG